MPENTSRRDPMLHLLGALSEGSSGYIENMEADGQRQLVNSTDLPTKLNGDDLEDFGAVGFDFGPPHEHDPMFRPATLPKGWKRQGSDHSMWSYIVDQYGRRRVSIFYKAAFYDRDANMSLVTPSGYLQQTLWDKAEPVLDDEWLTRDVALAELDRMYARRIEEADEADGYAAKGAGSDGYWAGRAVEHRAEAETIANLRAKIAADAGREA